MDTDIITYPTQEIVSVCIRKNSSNTKETLNTHNSCHKEYSALKKERKKKKRTKKFFKVTEWGWGPWKVPEVKEK